MFAWSLVLLVSLACLGAAHPIQSDVESQMMLLRERRAVGAALSSELIEELPEAPEARAEEETPALIEDTKDEAERTPKVSKVTKVSPVDDDDEDVTAPLKGGKSRSGGSVYRNFFPMTFGARLVREVETEEDVGDVQANAKAQPIDHTDEDDDVSSRSGGSVYRNFFPMAFGDNSRYTREAEGFEGRGGGVISIANSFSKGRGAVASSSATAYGSASPSAAASQQKSAPPPPAAAIEE